jgi:hypothetical protein
MTASSAISADMQDTNYSLGDNPRVGCLNTLNKTEKETKVKETKQIKKPFDLSKAVDSENMVVRMMKKPELQNFLKMIRQVNKEVKEQRGGFPFHLKKNDMGYDVYTKKNGTVIRVVSALVFRHFYTVRMDSKLFNQV